MKILLIMASIVLMGPANADEMHVGTMLVETEDKSNYTSNFNIAPLRLVFGQRFDKYHLDYEIAMHDSGLDFFGGVNFDSPIGRFSIGPAFIYDEAEMTIAGFEPELSRDYALGYYLDYTVKAHDKFNVKVKYINYSADHTFFFQRRDTVCIIDPPGCSYVYDRETASESVEREQIWLGVTYLFN